MNRRTFVVCVSVLAEAGLAVKISQAENPDLEKESTYAVYETTSVIEFRNKENKLTRLELSGVNRDLVVKTPTGVSAIPWTSVKRLKFENTDKESGLFEIEFREGSATYKHTEHYLFGLVKKTTWDAIRSTYGSDLDFEEYPIGSGKIDR